MSDSESDKKTVVPEWWNERIVTSIREKWKLAVDDYFKFKNIPLSHERFNLGFVKRVIKHVDTHDPRWADFDVSMFNIDDYNAHQAMYNTIETHFKHLVKQEAKLKTQAQKKKQESQA